MTEVDSLDFRILRVLQKNGRAAYAEIARETGLAESTVRDRVRMLERDGVIQGYTVVLDRSAVGLGSEALIFCNIPPEKHEAVCQELEKIPNVHSILFVSGERRVVLRVAARTNQELRAIVHSRVIPLGVTDVDSRIVMGWRERFPPDPIAEEPEKDAGKGTRTIPTKN